MHFKQNLIFSFYLFIVQKKVLQLNEKVIQNYSIHLQMEIIEILHLCI